MEGAKARTSVDDDDAISVASRLEYFKFIFNCIDVNDVRFDVAV